MIPRRPADQAGLRASMGPRLFSRGNASNFFTSFWLQTNASMGPRLFSRGNSVTPSETTYTFIGFNGATTFQPWKSRPFFGPSRCRKISLFREVHEWCLSTKGPMPGKAILFAFPIIVSSASQDSDHHLTSRKPFILLLPFSPSPPDEHPGTLSCPLPVPQAAPGPRSSPCPRHA